MNYRIATLALVCTLFLSTGAPAADSNPALSGRNDIVYLSLPTEVFEALPIGNGMLGAMVSAQHGITIKLTPVAFYTSLDGNQGQRSSCEVDLILDDKLKAEFRECRLELGRGRVVWTFGSGDSATQIEIFVAEGINAVAVYGKGPLLPDEWTVRVRGWLRSEHAGNKPPAVRDVPMSGSGAIGLVTQAESKQLTSAVALKPLGGTLEAVPGPDEFSQSAKVRFSEPGMIGFLIANPLIAGADSGVETAWAEALRVVKEAAQISLTSLINARNAWWHEFWDRSNVSLGSSDGFAEYVETLYNLHLFCMGAMSRGAEPAKFNGGAFLLSSDWRSWGGEYWYQNTRELYWPLLASGHTKLFTPLFELYFRNLPAARKAAADIFGAPGACVQETIGRDGRGDKASNPGIALYHTTGTEVAHQMLKYYDFTGDDAFLKTIAYPFTKEVLKFHLSFVEPDASGQLSIFPSNARETYRFVKNSVTDLSALKAVLPKAIAASEKLGVDPELRKHWIETLQGLPLLVRNAQGNLLEPGVLLDDFPVTRYPIIEAIYKPASKTRSLAARRNTFNTENVMAEPVYPWSLYGLDSTLEDRRVMEATFRARPNSEWTFGNAWDWSGPVAARLGLSRAVLGCFKEYVRNIQMFPSGLGTTPAGMRPELGGILPGEAGFDSSGVLATTVQEMLLQTYGGIVRIFPAVPTGWSAGFHLHGEGGITVEASKSASEIERVEISASRPVKITVVNPWPASRQIILTRSNTAKGEPMPDRLELSLEKGANVVLAPADAPAAAPVKFERRTGPQWPDVQNTSDTAEAYLDRQSKASLIGITEDGRNPARVKLRRAMADFPPAQTVVTLLDRPAETSNGILPLNAPISNAGTIDFEIMTPWDWTPENVKGNFPILTAQIRDQPGASFSVYCYVNPPHVAIAINIHDAERDQVLVHIVKWQKDTWHRLQISWTDYRTQILTSGGTLQRALWDPPTKPFQTLPEILIGESGRPEFLSAQSSRPSFAIRGLRITDQPENPPAVSGLFEIKAP